MCLAKGFVGLRKEFLLYIETLAFLLIMITICSKCIKVILCKKILFKTHFEYPYCKEVP